ncbi:MAG: Do family serine endopeptidase [Bacteroidetes bacterium]|nr:Do family serine endopeptidase [Bacteroidota bacterium]
MKKIVGYFLAAFVGGVAASFIGFKMQSPQGTSVSDITNPYPVKYVNMNTSTPENTIDFTKSASMSVHAVVHVKTISEVENVYNSFDPWHDFFFGPQQRQPHQQMSSGSGVIISPDGYIITNNHVVSKADKIEITLNDKRTFTAKVIGKDPTTDLALLKIDEKNLPYLSYGNSDELKIGEWVLAVGNPFNLNSTVTAGIVSAKARNINIITNNNKGLPAIESFIQTDAAVNPGNSGGALVTTNGLLIGINSAIASNTGSYTGYSFAIPVNIVRKVVADLLEFGEVQRAFIGVNIRDLDSKLAQEKNISDLKGVYVEGLTEGGSAEEAGIVQGDIISKIADVNINNVPELQEQVSRFRPGDKIMVTIKRDGKEKIIPVMLKNKDGNVDLVKKETAEVFSVLGASFEDASVEEKKKLNIGGGLKITNLGSGKLRVSGIKEGFIITSVDKKKVNTIDDLKAALENKLGGVLIEGVYPNGTKGYYAFGI